MTIKQTIATIYQKFSRWTVVTTPGPAKAVYIGAPHTSYWDGLFMAIAFWTINRPFKFLVKNSLINGPIGPIVRWIGGVGVDRSSSNGLVSDIVKRATEADEFTLIIAPKGTRSPRKYWKSGFYHIALEADIPVYLGFVDRKTMSYGFKDSIKLTGDVSADMDKIRAYYAGMQGVRPEKGSVPRLRIEDEKPDGPGNDGEGRDGSGTTA